MKFLSVLIALAVAVCAPPSQAAGIHTIFYAHIPPFVSETNGEVVGPTAEVVSRIMEMAEQPATEWKYRNLTWNRALTMTESDEGLGLLGVAKTPQREGKFKWVGPIGHAALWLWAYKSRNIRPKIFQELHKYRVAVVRDSAPEHILINKFNFTTHELEQVRRIGTQLRMLEEGRVDMVALSSRGAMASFRAAKMNPDEFEPVWKMMEIDFFLALNSTTDDTVVDGLQKALDQLKTKKPGEAKSQFDLIYESIN